MTYRGDVRPGSDPQVRELAHLSITKVAVDPEMSNNCYLLRCRETGEQLLVDAAAEPDTLLPLVGGAGLACVVTTHQHWDHHRALAPVVAATGAAVLVGEPDADAVTEQTGVEVTRRLAHGDTVEVGRCRLEVLAIAGHTPGSVALRYDDPEGQPHLFTGDSLFPGGVGATFGDEAAFRQLVDEVEHKIFATLPDETWFYPGHGDDSTIGAERPHLAQWRERGW
ncbi:glyoxylase-like metal-dependent hydrolase (beta-lactamase superfamily II) [Nocardioides marinisabuli]|uniref:Glyoxylase-like metal-dependent hydrolase (Beta-lactamase superfamily II) n=1 Tax=Nocardioides marinisabuli TaxID=419476 RepID=A0A7Y9JRF8_9ACTN|nr:MBL fold metallo-hydrolase [Nocardioides marinisabuli]NYD59167.1 glyoxylase-like metal-dependent hydrolase (beta-lactamase superfamily II) [Nocardioides marinisabuli]